MTSPTQSPAPMGAGAVPTVDALLDPAARVAPTLALLATRWDAAAGPDASADWLHPLLPRLGATDGGGLAAEARRADRLATLATTLAADVRAAGSGLDGFLAAIRRRPRSAAGSLPQRLDAMVMAVTDVELEAQTAARHARIARAAATVASRPSAELAHEQLALQARALGQPLHTRPDGTAPADATAAWAAAWDLHDPRAGAACLAAVHVGTVIALALRNPDVDAASVHAFVAAELWRLADEAHVAAPAPVATAAVTPAATPAVAPVAPVAPVAGAPVASAA